jgi:hypothetical protein
MSHPRSGSDSFRDRESSQIGGGEAGGSGLVTVAIFTLELLLLPDTW